MLEPQLLGAKVRALRRREKLTQAQLAEKLSVSPAYLNLIENNRRSLTVPLLIRLAQLFQLDLKAFAASEDARLEADLEEVFGDPLFRSQGLASPEIREMSAGSPGIARAVLTLYEAYKGARESVAMLSERVSDGESTTSVDMTRLPSEEVSDFVQRHGNYFPALEDGAESLWKEAQLGEDDRFRGLARGLSRFLEKSHGIRVEIAKVDADRRAVRRFEPATRRLSISEVLSPSSRNFQIAHQLGLLTQSATIDRIVREQRLSTEDSRALCRVALANYFAGAVLMPYSPFLEAARAVRYDVELLQHRFRTSFEQICHRLTTLRRPSAEGVPFHFIRIDIAGNISKRFSASGIRFARFAGACPLWNVHRAFLTPGMIRVQLSQMPDGTTYFCIARTIRKGSGGFHAPHAVLAIGMGCDVRFARELVYSDGVDLGNLGAAVPIGVSCRLCERMDCEQRAFPPLRHPLHVDENVRGISFYAPVPGRP
jgi:predicted transcriptional regulator/transcriptional regulator with XRE-family HTH domain